MNTNLSKFSTKPYENRFGSWRNALVAFIDYVNDVFKDTSFVTPVITNPPTSLKASRNINHRLRFLVLKRDNFKCCACGASPAKDPSVELHIDHIIPWSKGGETTIDNLQTLCSKCNLGKSNLT
ncbi:MAG: HNH endonuclease [Clostridia bacterium]|nr:HNH endonuclease [Clostridia bacterium]